MPQDVALHRYPLIGECAAMMGVHRDTMRRALNGTWPNPHLVKAYREYLAGLNSRISIPAEQLTVAPESTGALHPICTDPAE